MYREISMPVLDLETTSPLKHFVTEVSPNDAMFDTSEHYVRVGISALKLIEYAINHGFTKPSGPQTILDLPCGHGRVARVLRSRFPDADLTVCDIDRDGVDFCANKFGATGVYGTTIFDTMNLGKLFDLIWVGSLITHFNADQTVKFIQCMTRHLLQDGLLILTSHGKTVLRNAVLSAVHYGLAYTRSYNGRISISNVIDNMRTRYRTMVSINTQYHNIGYGYQNDPHIGEWGFSIISKQWFEGFFAAETYGIVEYLEKAWDNRQDVLFVKKKEYAAAIS
jgi:SAM-dependent methyltransferase